MKKIFALAVNLFLLTFILYSQDTEISKNLKDKEFTDSNNEFFSYIENGNIDKVRELLRLGIDVNSVNSEGWSALHEAVRVNNSEVVKELLSHKKINMNPVLPADTILLNGNNKWYADGQTPLLLASYYRYSGIVSMLLNYGADIMARDSVDDAMAIHIASARGYSDVISVILDSSAARNSGADIANIGDNSGTTPLMWAAMNNQVSAMSVLIRYNADINMQDDDGWTPLHFAAASDSYRAAELLLKNNADVNIADVDGKKASDVTDDTDIQALLNQYITESGMQENN
ncbi:ankyrin repeat domain-containing protein [uncultured Brachyspira sp.]|uniref:ankyrin repeat domain-containing protein n=1 Tax=uncultured Brachyspira sp. TaxID=221953 RepID=UPI0025F30EFC|nr:ankyrin repeat domain-containing protein [uncultured Brachyspira sp.]